MDSQERPLYGKNCIVTGASSGIGRETAAGLAEKGAHVILVVRNMDQGEEARREIIARTKNKNVEVRMCDLSSQSSIRAFAEEYIKVHEHLHVLVNNAALLLNERRLTVDGAEMTFAVNHLGPFLLTSTLLPLLKKSAPSRIVNVASKIQSHIDFDDLQNEKRFDGVKAYSQSKLANVMFTYELAEKLASKSVTVNCLHPGVVNTSLTQEYPWFPKYLSPLLGLVKPLLTSPKDGAKNSIYLASSPNVQAITGKFFIGSMPAKSHRQSYDVLARRRLWGISEMMTGAVYDV